MAAQQGNAGVGVRLFALSAAVLCAAAAAFTLLFVVQHIGATPAQMNIGYFALAVAVAALLALCTRWLASGRDLRALSAPADFRGLALATDTISGAFVVALTGAIFAWGYDGLAFALGLGAGYLLLQLVVAPKLPVSGASSLSEFFASRYGQFAGGLAGIAIVVSMAAFLVAQLMAAGLIGARLLGIEYAAAVAIAAAVVFGCFMLRGKSAVAWMRSVLFLLMLAAFLAPTVLISMERYGIPVPQAAYGDALIQIRNLEETLLEQELADPAVMVPMLTPFLELSPLNFLGIVLGLAVGVASLPSVLSRHLVVPPARSARWAGVGALLFGGLFLTAAPALAAYAKLSLLTLIADKTQLADLPGWIFVYGKLGLVEVCGRAATDTAAVVEACAALPDASSILRLQDLTLQPDMVALAAPEIAGLDQPLFGLLAAAALAAALVTADGPLFALAAALGWDGRAPDASRALLYVIAAVAIALGAAVAVLRPASILTTATWAFMLAAGGLFPALFAGLWWRRTSGPAAAIAIVVGLGVSLYYLVGTRYFAVSFFETWPSLSNSGEYARETYVVLKQAWVSAPAGEAKAAAWVALEAHARGLANWWGIRAEAIALLSLPAGLGSLIVVSLITPRRRPKETAL